MSDQVDFVNHSELVDIALSQDSFACRPSSISGLRKGRLGRFDTSETICSTVNKSTEPSKLQIRNACVHACNHYIRNAVSNTGDHAHRPTEQSSHLERMWKKHSLHALAVLRPPRCSPLGTRRRCHRSRCCVRPSTHSDRVPTILTFVLPSTE